jgi:bifunctional N-acetylglucosamine-1-phosphate-uridyltransferase/glucosamine-1-phosphate-acetyltransferase GlmU-like protein
VERLLVIPAAGSGSRLGASLPKVLVPVNGRAMIDHLLGLYAGAVDRVVVIVSPTAREAVAEQVRQARAPVRLVLQEAPTGMLDAILLAREIVDADRPRRILVTWCDQIAIMPATVESVIAAARSRPEPDLVLPTCRGLRPYVHIQRDAAGHITGVLHRREGDRMPEWGESDAGVFDLSLRCYQEWLPGYAAAPEIGARTGERNFVPFVAWVAAHGLVTTVPCTEPEEAIGVNTPEELAVLEAHLRRRAQR